MGETVLVIGGGAREHAITWKLTQSALVEKAYVSPGNPGTASLTKAENVSLDLRDHQVVADFCLNHHIRLVVVGPEDPLAEGISDSLAARGIACFGPSQQAAQIEASKEFSKQFMQKHGIPTARFASFTDAEKAKGYIQTADFPALVVKASGLAAGKGVIVAESTAEACAAVDELMSTPAGGVIVVEELLEGDEVSALAFSDGETAAIMWPSQDHKRLLEEDRGPNTGGMGAYCPCPLLNQEQWRTVEKEILQKTVDCLRQDGILYRGVLYAGLMVTKDGPKVLEFNCRFGDPETEVILPLLESDLLSIMKACVSGTLKQALPLKWKEDHVAVGVVMASEGYPGSYPKGKVISGLNELPSNCITFHAGTASHATDIVTSGGRVLCVVGLAPGIQPALNAALEGVGQIHFDGAQHRRDIARRGIARALLQKGKLKYEHAGVSIDNGEAVVRSIKPLIESTFRSGVVGTIGGFGGLFDLKKAGYSNPLLVSGTDGVGTKVKIAQELDIHNTVGIDLVAMCVNDILAHGAEPLFFLDYLASGKLHVETNVQLVAGIAEGCRQAGCSLVGGETAEMPGMYPPGEYDLAGFTVGAVEESQLIPRMADIQSGDVLIGLASSGVHSNGFSLVRKVVEKSKLTFRSASPFSSGTLGEALLTPTKIYVKTVLPLIREGYVKALAHITGGGLIENIPRVLPPTKCVTVDAGRWPIPPVFGWLAAAGEISEPEMVRTFNCGLGLVLIVDPTDAEKVLKLIGPTAQASVVGTVQDWNPEHPRVQVKNFATALEPLMRPHLQVPKKKKRIGVLISGSGTNLQALIDHTMNPYKCSEGEIVVVISNVAGVQGLVRAEKANIRTEVISHKDFSTRLDFDNTVTATLKKYHVDFVCLAGFMRILTKEFVAKWHGRLINIHPALLPSFKGIHAQKQALEAGVTISGCTVHFVETEVDTGAIISQRAVPVLASDNEETLVERIKEAEHLVYPEALELLVSGLVSLGADGRLQRHST